MSILTASLLVLATGSTGAAEPPAAQATPSKENVAETAKHDPMVCQAFNELGSRLKRRKVCMHKSEWDRQSLEEKQMIDRTQVLRGMTPAG